MTTQDVNAQLMLNTGESVNLSSNFVDGTESELQTSGVVAAGGGISAQSIGTYADGKTITSIILPPTAATMCVYAYIARRGEIAACIPVANLEVVSEPIPFIFRLAAGDTIRCFTLASATARNVALNVVSNSGVNAIFSVTPTGADTNNLTHILSGQTIGQSLQGQRIVSHYVNSVEGSLYRGGSVLYLNDRGLPQGGCIATNPNNLQISANSNGTTMIQLNSQAVAITTA